MPLRPDVIAEASKRHAAYLAEFARDRECAGLFVLSYPKSGRTWHRALLGQYLARICGFRPERAFDLDELCLAAGTVKVVYSHNGANFTDGLLPHDEAIASADLWRDMPVILLVRDPREILVSAYHHARFRMDIFDGPISEFVREPRTGIDKIAVAFSRWRDRGSLAASLDVTSYRALHEDAGAVLRRALNAIGLSDHDERTLREAVASCRFEVMQEQERIGFFRTPRMRNLSEDHRGAKIREGKTGASSGHLSQDDLAFIETRMRVAALPFGEHYSEGLSTNA